MPKKPNNDQMPEIVFIGPGRQKAKFKQVLFVIETKDEDGRPSKVRMCREDEVFDLAAADAAGKQYEFLTGYVPAYITKGK